MSWARAIAFVLSEEGGYISDPNDPGGETNMGISKRFHPTLDIKNLTIDQAKSVYFTDYWLAAGCQNLPEGLDLMHFDCAVNEGVSTANAILATAAWSVAEYAAQRIVRYAASPLFSRYGLGWSRRVIAALVAATGGQA
jgi:lysozyme family protein